MKLEHQDLARRFVQYISDDLPPEIPMPDSIELGNALLEAQSENVALRAALEPFARLIYPQRAKGEYPILPPLPGREPITVKHVENARRALGEIIE